MSVTPSSATSPLTVAISPGQTASAPPSIVSFGFNAETGAIVQTMSDGSQLSAPGLAAAIAQSLGGASLAVLDANGSLILGGEPRLGVSPAGNLTMPTTPPTQGLNNYQPVTGSGEIYENGGPLQVA